MAMNFFEHQEQARKKSRWLVLLFGAAVIGIAVAIYVILRVLYGYSVCKDQPNCQMGWWDPVWFAWIFGGTVGFVGMASTFRILSLRSGGSSVAEMMGGRLVTPEARDPLERRLRNVVEEMAIASGVPVPAVYVLDGEEGINAFAAGFTPDDAAVAVTRGCLEALDRDQLQGVIAHEFSHILNGDMRLNIRLMGVLFGILAIAVVGRVIVSVAGRSRGSSKKDGGGAAALVVTGLVLLVVGYIGVFVGRIIQAAVSRQREFLADASAVQFTRNPLGISGALKRIAGWASGSAMTGQRSVEVGHLLFGQGQVSWLGGLMATHPPLEERVRRLDPSFVAEQAAQEAKDAGSAPAAVPSPAAAGAAGFAGGAAGARATIDPGSVVGRVGNPSAEHVARGAGLREAIPAEVMEALATADGAVALCHALLLDRDDAAVREAQTEYLRREAGEAPTTLALDLFQALDGVHASWRLPLLDLAAPALRALPPDATVAFLRRLEDLAAADRRVTIFEFALQRLVGRRLARRRPKDDHPSRERATTADLEALLAMLALAGHDGDDQAARSLAQAASQVPGLSAERLSATLRQFRGNPPGFGALGPALDRLSRAPFDVRQRAIAAASQVVLADGQVTLEEAELLRVVAVSLDCPLPPFLETL